MDEYWLVLGDQLFPVEGDNQPECSNVFMAEDEGLCTHFRYHKQKLVLFLSGMRHHRDALEDAGFSVTYHELSATGKDRPYVEKLKKTLVSGKVEVLHAWEIEDAFFRGEIEALCEDLEVELRIHASPMFLQSREEVVEAINDMKKPFMKTFYERRRRDTGILMTKDGEPEGGSYSYDADNREKLPADVELPDVPRSKPDAVTKKVIKLVAKRFGDHPGELDDFWWPVTRQEAEDWLSDFIEHRLVQFGPYEDALSQRGDVLFHTALSPLLNCGLLLPGEVLDAVLEAWEEGDEVPINSVEGLVRQVMGWREFIRGIYHIHGEEEEASNTLEHDRALTDAWYDGTTGIPVLDDVIKKTQRLGWAHHIERLMVVGNLMLLCEIHPDEVYRWFMEMFVDSADWVMVPNVYGMSQWSDGGLFATKPYVCGSSYLRKMSDYKKGDWCDIVDGLYWGFIERHRERFADHHRMRMMVSALDKLKSERRETIFPAAKAFRERVTRALD